MSDDRSIILEEVLRRGGKPSPVAVQQAKRWMDAILGALFQQQVDFILDPSKIKAAHPGRRAGKTYACASYLALVALQTAGVTCLYLALTRKIAKKLMWPELKRLNTRFGLGMVFNNSDLICYLPNGSMIQLGGCEDASEVDKYRGDKYALVVIDEAASFGAHFPELIEEALEPALMDLNGVLVMVGTPANHCTGPFWEACTDPESGYSVHHWTMLDNPHLPHAADWLERKRKAKRWETDNAIYQREYMGRWIRSTESVVYWYDPAINGQWDGVLDPRLEWGYIVGVDLGATDDVPKTAFTVVAYSEDDPTVRMVESRKTLHMTPTEIAGELREIAKFYGEPRRIVMDHGALGKAIARECTKRHGIPIAPAEKREKLDYIELMNDDLKKGTFVVDAEECGDWIGEVVRLQWDEDRKKEDKRFPNHCADSGLYAYREALHWAHEPEEPPGPEEGTDEYWEEEAAKVEAAAVDRFMGTDTDQPWWLREQ